MLEVGKIGDGTKLNVLAFHNENNKLICRLLHVNAEGKSLVTDLIDLSDSDLRQLGEFFTKMALKVEFGERFYKPSERA